MEQINLNNREENKNINEEKISNNNFERMSQFKILNLHI